MAKAVRKLKYVTQQDIDNYWEDMYEKYENDMISYGAMNREEGKEEGREQGKTEREKEIAKNMLEKCSDIEFIIEVTGLSKEEIENLKD